MPALYVVATPIGNLGEMAPRAIDTLRQSDLILAEDTRVTRKLLSHFGIHVPVQSNHRHNEREQAQALAQRMLREQMTVSLVSDAGTPGISDPGAALVHCAAEAGIPVYPVAGPSAIAAALSISGFSAAAYAFYGFPPRTEGERRKFLLAMRAGPPIAVLFESPHRVIGLMGSLTEALPQARICLCCDLTKRYELTLRGSPADVLSALQANPSAEKGEYVLVCDLSGCEAPKEDEGPSAQALIAQALMQGATLKQAVDFATGKGVPRNEAYKASLFVKEFLKIE